MICKGRATTAMNHIPSHSAMFEGEHWFSLFKEDDMTDLYSKYHMPLSVLLRTYTRDNEDVIIPAGSDEVCFDEETLKARSRLPIPMKIRAVLAHLNLTPVQI